MALLNEPLFSNPSFLLFPNHRVVLNHIANNLFFYLHIHSKIFIVSIPCFRHYSKHGDTVANKSYEVTGLYACGFGGLLQVNKNKYNSISSRNILWRKRKQLRRKWWWRVCAVLERESRDMCSWQSSVPCTHPQALLTVLYSQSYRKHHLSVVSGLLYIYSWNRPMLGEHPSAKVKWKLKDN